MPRILVIGLDGLCPNLVERWRPELPHLQSLMQRGIYGPLQSIVQPVTPVAWTSMLTGYTPGQFGFTDFTYRPGNQSYTDFQLVHSQIIHTPTLYTLLPKAGYRLLMVGVPISYPPVEIANGVCVSCFMAPSLKQSITRPSALQPEILASTSSPYLLDVSLADMAGEIDRAGLVRRLHELDRQRFDVARFLMQTQPWDVLFMVCMGTDRVGHYFMRYQDQTHGRYDADPRYQNAMHDHYTYCDERIGELISLVDNDTIIMVVSDHGMQPLDGKVNINDWLVAKGYLQLQDPVQQTTSLKNAAIDWTHTKAWAHGYGGQIYLNIQGRDPQGCIPPDRVEETLQALEADIQDISDPTGKRLKVETIRRTDIYRGARTEICPDLFVQFEGLRYTTSDLLGHTKMVTPIRELGPDDAAHAPDGFFVMAGPEIPNWGRFAAAHLLDILPTMLDLLKIAPASDLEGHLLHKTNDIYTQEDQEELTSRLQTLYLE